MPLNLRSQYRDTGKNTNRWFQIPFSLLQNTGTLSISSRWGKCSLSVFEIHLFISRVSVSLRSAHGQLAVREDIYFFKFICSYKESRSSHGPLTASSLFSHGQGRYLPYVNASVHTSGHGHVTGRSTEHGYLKKPSDRKLIRLSSNLYRSCTCIFFKQNKMCLSAVWSLQCATVPISLTVSLPWY